MAQPAVQITGVRAVLDPAALARKQVRAEVTDAVLRVSDRGLAAVLSPAGVQVDRISNGRIFLRKRHPLPVVGLVDVSLEYRPSLGQRGRIVFDLLSFRAGMFSVPGFVVSGLIAGAVRGKPGIHITEDNRIELDLGEVLAEAGIRLPAPRALGADGGILEVAFQGS